ncbi:hypothetical protein NEMBOFW57_009695 [Staphylotrichum longicolle]|uniref:Cytosolic iron-sulfur protein assembly protein 1 n=1 Tax=Staphylotrichum longicolle TaxID=669026 RepID=A0AAD4HW67_9PEZI|nr:hypothetical protein NEMBOFW57_009695 [Staphylotrichum longicolle]
MTTPAPPAPAGAEADTQQPPAATATATAPTKATLTPLPPFQPDLYQRAWSSIPHPSLPLLATATPTPRGGGGGGANKGRRLGLVTGSFDATAGMWSYEEGGGDKTKMMGWRGRCGSGGAGQQQEIQNKGGEGEEEEEKEWEFNLVLEGHENEYLATCSRDKSVWIWEDVSTGDDDDDEWETVAVLSEHDGDVKAVACADVLASASYDNTVRIWREDADGSGSGGNAFKSAFGGVPNTMRRSLREEWDCTAVLPKVHTRDIYSATWSAETGLVASTGSDGVIAVYAEDDGTPEDVAMSSPSAEGGITENGRPAPKSNWKVLGTVSNAHGPYEVNHVTWCKRFDAGAERKGKEEMLVTTGDDGVVRPWQVRIA